MHDKTLPLNTISHFDDEADVIVLGYGIAGACAALESRRLGGDVLVVERASAGGGASALSSGLFYLGGGTAVQQACGYTDSADDMYRYMISSMGSENADLIRRYCEENVAHFDWLEAQGVPFERSCYNSKAVFLLTTEGLLATGNEKVWPYRELASPAPRGHQATGPGETPGAVAMAALLERCQEAGVRSRCDSRALALIVDGNQVCGVQVRCAGKIQHLRARRAVIIATGGFSMNSAMTQAHLPLLSETSEPLGSPYSDGIGISLGKAAGAATDAMDGMIATASIYPPEQLIKGIIVNQQGQRFVAEDSYHGRTAAFIMEQPQQRAYLIVDADIFAYPEITSANHALIDGYETIAEMESHLEMPAGSLTRTISDYNAQARDGQDSLFYKDQQWLKPLDAGPWAAFDLSFNRSAYLYMTLGGLKISTSAEVLNNLGLPIPNLYAAGACTAHIPKSGKSYASGMSLGPGSFFGRIAGISAMAEPSAR